MMSGACTPGGLWGAAGLCRGPHGLPGTLQPEDTNRALNLRQARLHRPPSPASPTCLLTLFPFDKARMVFNNAGPHLTQKRPVAQK